MTAVEQDLSDIAEAFPGDAPVDTIDLNLPDSGESNSPEPERRTLPDIEENHLPVSPENLPREDQSTVHFPTQTILRRNENIVETESGREHLRRSTRDRKGTRRLTYPELGNPLVQIVQSLFQSLHEVITNSLTESSFSEPHRVMTV